LPAGKKFSANAHALTRMTISACATWRHGFPNRKPGRSPPAGRSTSRRWGIRVAPALELLKALV